MCPSQRGSEVSLPGSQLYVWVPDARIRLHNLWDDQTPQYVSHHQQVHPRALVAQDLVMARGQGNKSGTTHTDRELRSKKKVSGRDEIPQTAPEKVMEWLATIPEGIGEDSGMDDVVRESSQTE